jgi:hypothetical protein
VVPTYLDTLLVQILGYELGDGLSRGGRYLRWFDNYTIPSRQCSCKKNYKKIEVRTCKPYYRFFKQFMLSLKAKGRRQIKALLVPVLASITTPLWI